jgi:site-specific recombinase XerD
MSRLRQLGRWLEANGHGDPPVYEIPTAVIRKYYYHFSGTDKKLRPRLLRGALHALRCCFAWAQEVGLVEQDPSREIKLPRMDAEVRKLVQDSELEKLLAARWNQASEFRVCRPGRLVGRHGIQRPRIGL